MAHWFPFAGFKPTTHSPDYNELRQQQQKKKMQKKHSYGPYEYIPSFQKSNSIFV